MRVAYLQNHLPFTESFAESCFSLTPKVYKNGPYELFLDLSPTEGYFGGEDPLLLKIEDLLATHDIEPHLTLVDRIEWARPILSASLSALARPILSSSLSALARPLCQDMRVLLPKGKSQDALLRLPIEDLLHCGDPTKIEEESLDRQKLIVFMRRVGMKTISSFALLSPTAVNRRFGKLGVLLQQWVKGSREVCLPPLVLSNTLEEVLEADHIFSLDSLLLETRTALDRMEMRLCSRRLAVKELKFLFYLESGKELVRTVALSEPMQEAQQMMRYLKLFFESLEWDSPLSRLTVLASKTVTWSPGQLSLIDKTENQFYNLSQFVERLQKRLGQDSVGVPEIHQSYIPERSWKKTWPPSDRAEADQLEGDGRAEADQLEGDDRAEADQLEGDGRAEADQLEGDAGSGSLPTGNLPVSAQPTPSFLERPLFLFEMPRHCSPAANWNLLPSENIAAEWWRGEGGLRRYFKAVTPIGEALWIFWNGKSWFEHGRYWTAVFGTALLYSIMLAQVFP